MRGPGEARVPRHRGHAPHGDQHLHGDSLPSPEADRGLRGPLEDVDGGEDRGHAPINAELSVSDELTKTLVRLNKSVIGRSPVTSEQTGSDIGKSQYCPSWLQMNFLPKYSDTENQDKVSESDLSDIVSNFNSYCWQGRGGLKVAPVLPFDRLTDIRNVRSGPKGSPPVTDILHDNFCSQSLTTLTEICKTSR